MITVNNKIYGDSMPKVVFAAAYLDPESNNLIKEFGFKKEDFHLTTCLDRSCQIEEMPIYSFEPQTAIIKAIVEWPVGEDIFLVAELSECDWSKKLNTIILAYGAVETLPHNPHITLFKGCEAGVSKQYQGMVGMLLKFNRHVIKRKTI